MPRGDGTGPMGLGPMTGRAAGYCAGYPVPGYMNPIPGRGFGYGRGLGLGFRGGRRWGGWGGMPYGWSALPYGAAVPPYGAPYGGPTPEQEVELLKSQASHCEAALEGIRKRLSELESNPAQTK